MHRTRDKQIQLRQSNTVPKNIQSEDKSMEISKETRECLKLIRQQGQEDRFYAICEINSRPFSVSGGDVLVIKHMPGTNIGDMIALSRVREIGSKDYYIRGAPLVDKRFCDVQAVILQHPLSAKYTTYRRRLGQGPGDRKWRKRSYRDHLTVLRISKVQVADPDELSINK